MKELPQTTLTSRFGHAADEVAEQLRIWAREGQLSSGEHLRQDEIAAALGVTRVPVREAFKILVAEGLLTHEPNRGHFVARLDGSEFTQVYWMRRVLEEELTRTMKMPDAKYIRELRAINDKMRAASARQLREVVSRNRELHFRLFELSPQRVILRELGRLWDLTDQYRALHLYKEGVAERLTMEHDEMLDALEEGDREKYWRLLDEHRARGELAIAELTRVVEEGPAS